MKNSVVHDQMAVRFLPDGSIFVDDVTDGITFTKRIRSDDLIRALRDSVIRESYSVFSGLLPRSCIAYTHNLESGSRYVAMEFSDGKADVAYMNTEYPEFPLPIGIFRRVQKPTYEDTLKEQEDQIIAAKGTGSIKELLRSGDTWEVV